MKTLLLGAVILLFGQSSAFAAGTIDMKPKVYSVELNCVAENPDLLLQLAGKLTKNFFGVGGAFEGQLKVSVGILKSFQIPVKGSFFVNKMDGGYDVHAIEPKDETILSSLHLTTYAFSPRKKGLSLQLPDEAVIVAEEEAYKCHEILKEITL